MSKKNKSNKGFISDTPEIYSVDVIGYMADEAIHERAQRLEHERNVLLSMNKDPLLWEIEIAYLRREQQLRQTRAERHADYLKKFLVNPNEVDLNDNSQSDGPQELN